MVGFEVACGVIGQINYLNILVLTETDTVPSYIQPKKSETGTNMKFLEPRSSILYLEFHLFRRRNMKNRLNQTF